MQHHLDEEHIPIYEIRPRFEFETDLSAEEIQSRISQALENSSTCRGHAHHGYGMLALPEEEIQFWSPQLNFSLEKKENGGTMVSGLMGPRPAVWTMIVFFYSVLGFAAMIVSIIGFSNKSLGQSAAILWLLPLLIIAFLTLYIVAWFGKRWSRNQMIVLHRFFEESSGLKIP